MDKAQFKEAEDWGVNCYCIKVFKAMSEQEEIYVYGDNVTVTDDGSLHFSTILRMVKEEVTFIIATDNKSCFICN
jgi:hypothetical protein